MFWKKIFGLLILGLGFWIGIVHILRGYSEGWRKRRIRWPVPGDKGQWMEGNAAIWTGGFYVLVGMLTLFGSSYALFRFVKEVLLK
ncbi:MAG: hypothetical protein EBS05_21500 [Proteobacteria bacterium]|jgi:hypothetical protein|nr:hypothetical protein [Pseudomonadota bacterium]NDE99138.1 hypothetical protein [Verrucomicrobiota bacterium]